MIAKYSNQINKHYLFSVAPMMDCTDRHFRVLMRQISKKALLYTEMVVAQALQHSNRLDRLLGFDEIEHPIALQLGGDDPKLLAEAARIGEDWGYDEINLNIGCPSPRVVSGNFGASLMGNPEQVAQCIEAMTDATNIPITVKHRLGIDNLDSDELLINFIDLVHQAGAKRFAVHARKAWLNGLNPKENRNIPPLEYERVEKLKEIRPNLIIELNGGIRNLEDCLKALIKLDGAMVGRAAYEHPLRWSKVDELVYNQAPKVIKASSIINQLIPYAEKHQIKNGRLWDIGRHLLNLVQEVPGARGWRRDLSLKAQSSSADPKVLEEAAQQLKKAGL